MHAQAIIRATAPALHAANVQIMQSNAPAERPRFVQKAHGRQTDRVQMRKSAKAAAARTATAISMSMKINVRTTPQLTAVRMEIHAESQPMAILIV
jgi:hypothetical protein